MSLIPPHRWARIGQTALLLLAWAIFIYAMAWTGSWWAIIPAILWGCGTFYMIREAWQ